MLPGMRAVRKVRPKRPGTHPVAPPASKVEGSPLSASNGTTNIPVIGDVAQLVRVPDCRKKPTPSNPGFSGVFAFFTDTSCPFPDPTRWCQRVSAMILPFQASITTIAAFTFVPCSLNEPAGRSIHAEQISPNSSRCRGPFAQIATSRPPGFELREGVLDVVDVRPVLEGRVHHDPVELAQAPR